MASRARSMKKLCDHHNDSMVFSLHVFYAWFIAQLYNSFVWCQLVCVCVQAHGREQHHHIILNLINCLRVFILIDIKRHWRVSKKKKKKKQFQNSNTMCATCVVFYSCVCVFCVSIWSYPLAAAAANLSRMIKYTHTHTQTTRRNRRQQQ